MTFKKFRIPIYSCWLHAYIKCESVYAARNYKRCTAMFGPVPERDYFALSAYTADGNFGLWLPRKADTNTIAHELFHITHRILEWTNSNFDRDHHEQGALLNGYLHELVSPLC